RRPGAGGRLVRVRQGRQRRGPAVLGEGGLPQREEFRRAVPARGGCRGPERPGTVAGVSPAVRGDRPGTDAEAVAGRPRVADEEVRRVLPRRGVPPRARLGKRLAVTLPINTSPSP